MVKKLPKQKSQKKKQQFEVGSLFLCVAYCQCGIGILLPYRYGELQIYFVKEGLRDNLSISNGDLNYSIKSKEIKIIFLPKENK